MKVATRHEVRSAPEVNLEGHHTQCEFNYHLCMSLIPGCRSGRELWGFVTGNDEPLDEQLKVTLKLLESAPYTTTIDIVQHQGASYIEPSKIRVRLYHDVEMAEVVGWDHRSHWHRHWLPVYEYPNQKMYQPDEKLALNRFLGEWLSYCRKLGIACETFCECGRIPKK